MNNLNNTDTSNEPTASSSSTSLTTPTTNARFYLGTFGTNRVYRDENNVTILCPWNGVDDSSLDSSTSTTSGNPNPMSVACWEKYYQQFRVRNTISSSSKTFRWLIKPADRIWFKNGQFDGFYDNGLLYLREEIGKEPGSVDKSDTHYVTIRQFMTQMEERNLLRSQNSANSLDTGFDPVDPSLAALLDEKHVCPVCFEPIIGGITYSCENFHSICGGCKIRLEEALLAAGPDVPLSCPVCRSTRLIAKNDVFSEVYGLIELYCRYKGYGCQVKVSAKDMLQHLETCYFRPWCCYFCTEELTINTCENHLLRHHIKEIRVTDKALWLPACFDLEVPIIAYSERPYRQYTPNDEVVGNIPFQMCMFLIKEIGTFMVLELEFQKNSFYGWIVCLIAPKDACSKYKADFKLKTEYDMGGNRQAEFVYDEFKDQPVVSYQDKFKKLLEKIRSMPFPGKYGMAMKKFAYYGGCGRFTASMKLVIRTAEN